MAVAVAAWLGGMLARLAMYLVWLTVVVGEVLDCFDGVAGRCVGCVRVSEPLPRFADCEPFGMAPRAGMERGVARGMLPGFAAFGVEARLAPRKPGVS